VVPGFEISGLDEYNTFDTRGEITPGPEAVLSRMIEQHFRIASCRGQISDPKRDETAAVWQRVIQGGRVGERLCIADGPLHGAPRLVGEPPEPENPCQHDASYDPLIEPEPNESRPWLRIDIGAQHTFDMTQGIRVIAQVMVRCPDHPIRGRQVGRIGMHQHERVKSFGNGEIRGVSSRIISMNPKRPQRPQLVLGVAERFGKAESRVRGLPSLWSCTFGKKQRHAERRLQLHLTAGNRWLRVD
jgi:hypothetical protein